MAIHLIRHAHAGRRSDWDGPDVQRPLSDKGWGQAAAIADDLAGAGIGRLWTSPYVRCRQTLEPLSERLALPIEPVDDLGEGGGTSVLDRLIASAASGVTVAACSHGDVIPALVAQALGRGATIDGPASLQKGARYELTVVDGAITTIVHTHRPAVGV